MTTNDIAHRLVELCKEGKFVEAQQELYHENILRIETDGRRVEGAAMALEYEKQFLAQVEKMHYISYSEPQVAGSYFSVILSMQLDIKTRGTVTMEEVCVYRVQEDKIVFEQFFRD